MRRLALAAGLAATGCCVASCGISAQTARNPEPTASAPLHIHRAVVGQALTLTGAAGAADATGAAGLRLAVKVKEVVSATKGHGAFEKPRRGERFAAVRFVFKNLGETVYQDSPTFGAKLIDTEGHGYDPTVANVAAGPGFGRVVRLSYGQVRAGFIVFAIPRTARIARVQYALDAGESPDRGDWRVR